MPLSSKFCRLFCGYDYYLRVTEDRVDGTKDISDEYTALEMISFDHEERSRVLRGKSSRRYVGVNSDGHVVAFENLSDKCVFIEDDKIQSCDQKEESTFSTYSVFESKCHPLWYLGLTPSGNACAIPVPDNEATKNDVKYVETDLDAYAPLGRYENQSFKVFDVQNTLYTTSKRGIYWRYG